MKGEEREIVRLGKWLPDRTHFKENLHNFIYALLIICLMMIETLLPPFVKRGVAWYSFYIGAYLKYLLRAAFVLFIVLVLEKRPLSSLGFRNFKKNGLFFYREIFWTIILCLILLPGIRFAPSQPFYQNLSQARLLFHAVYILLAVSLVEEMVWRGFIFSRLSLSTGKLLALLISSIFNSLWHLPYYQKFSFTQGSSLLPSLAVTFIMALVMCFITLATERIIGRWNVYPVIALHWFGDIGFYLLNKIL